MNGQMIVRRVLRKRLVYARILTLPISSKSFTIYNDASKKRLGSVLMQGDMVIAYTSEFEIL